MGRPTSRLGIVAKPSGPRTAVAAPRDASGLRAAAPLPRHAACEARAAAGSRDGCPYCTARDGFEERGGRNLCLLNLERLAEALSLSLVELFGRVDAG
jgi:hypothetical protein